MEGCGRRFTRKYRELSLPIKVSFWFFFCTALQKGLSFIMTPVFTRLLTTYEYGITNVYSSWEQIMVIFVTFGVSNSIFNVGTVKYFHDKENYQSALLGLGTITTLFFSLVFLSFYRYFEAFIQLEFKYAVLMVFQCFFTTVVAMWSLRERFAYHYRNMVFITLANTFAGTLFSIYAVTRVDDKAYARIWGLLIITACLGVFCYAGFIKKSHRLFNRFYWKFAIAYNLPMIPHFLSTVLLNQMDRIMIKAMCSAEQAGIYSVAYNSAGAVSIVNQALAASYNPWLLQRLKKKQYSGIKRITTYILLVYMLLLVLIILLAPEVMMIMAARDYFEGIYVIPPVAGSMFFILLFNIVAPVEHFSLKTKFIAMASTWAGLVNLVTNYIFIKAAGYLAAGYTTLFCYIIYGFSHYFYMKKICRDNLGGISLFHDRAILGMSMFVILFSSASFFIYPYTAVRYFMIIMICILAGFGGKKIFSSFDKDSHCFEKRF